MGVRKRPILSLIGRGILVDCEVLPLERVFLLPLVPNIRDHREFLRFGSWDFGFRYLSFSKFSWIEDN